MTPFEAFAATDDSADYPMAFFGELRFHGELRRAEFARAVELATRRHPLLRAKVVMNPVIVTSAKASSLEV